MRYLDCWAGGNLCVVPVHELSEGALCGAGCAYGGGFGPCTGGMRGGAVDGLPEYGEKRDGGGAAAGSGVSAKLSNRTAEIFLKW